MWYCNVALFLNIKSFNINQMFSVKSFIVSFFCNQSSFDQFLLICFCLLGRPTYDTHCSFILFFSIYLFSGPLETSNLFTIH